MPSLPSFSFQQLHHILEEYQEYISPLMYQGMTIALDFAYDNDDNCMIQPLCWMVLQTRLGEKSLSEIIGTFYIKAQATLTPNYGQYVITMDAVKDAYEAAREAREGENQNAIG